MMQDILELTEGWTAAIDYDLENETDGVWASFNAATMTPSLTLRDKDGNAVTFTGTVSWAVEATSRIRFSPAATDLLNAKSPYLMHWKVTDGASKDAFYPQGTPILVRVFKP
jgi:hypothetical protein